jgi:hypothetical protein
MNGKSIMIVGVGLMVLSIFFKVLLNLSLVYFITLLTVSATVFSYGAGKKMEESVVVDEFTRRAKVSGQAYSWRATAGLVILLLFNSILNWLPLTTTWTLIIISCFMTVSYILFMIPLFRRGSVE